MAKWEPWQVEMLKEQYGKNDIGVISERIGKKRNAVIQYAYKHGISTGRYFSEEEEKYIEEQYGRMTAETIAKSLGRDYRAVINKINHMGIGNFLDNSEKLHLADVCMIVSRDKETIKRTWFKRGLKYQKRGRYTMISEENLLKFMKEHPEYWDATKCDYYFFQRFQWFQTKLLADRQANHERRWKIG